MEVLSNDNSKSLLTPCIFVFSRPEDVDLEVCVFAVATGDQLLWNRALAWVGTWKCIANQTHCGKNSATKGAKNLQECQ